MCVTKVVSSSLVLDIVFKLPVGFDTRKKKKAVMKTFGGSWNESLGERAVWSEEQAATCLVRHRHLLTGLYTLLQLLLCVNTSYTETYTHTTR